ncbi:ABC transporter ATP-binding protein [Bailinhaonella thermotolerans]|uniref:ABC transporter ATP-binding protein n=1 Tax=Bailinhaonella thermotolerans TaxID=1070861 RepID=A0A3A4BKJ8_9ACTN|nr:ABC transporter ATP-binding protein [Bailinhaonella thermotolerans]RJL31622.1 ABC transporter ATP-binding protein [Bailinhaonella thermotolerans]
MATVISAAGLVKTFGRTRALDGLDLEVAAGEIHGYLGPNGAGKTTTLRVLLGLIRPDGGRVRLLGGDPWRDAVALHRRLAYVAGDVALWPGLTGGETIDLLGRLRGGLDRRRRDELVERFGLDPSKRARAYSKGNRQKVALVSALSSRAELLLLDEPTTGLDPLMEVEFRRCLAERAREGVTVLLSSHVLAEVEALCDRVSIVRAGRVVESGRLADLRRLTRTTITADLDAPPPDLAAEPGVHALRADGPRVTLQADRSRLGPILARLAAAGVRDLTARPPTLEDLFLRHYTPPADAAGAAAAAPPADAAAKAAPSADAGPPADVGSSADAARSAGAAPPVGGRESRTERS